MTETYPLTPEILVPLIGDVLVEKGLLTKSQLRLGLERQKELKSQGALVPFGQLMVDMGFKPGIIGT